MRELQRSILSGLPKAGTEAAGTSAMAGQDEGEKAPESKRLNRLWSQKPLENISGFLYFIFYLPTRDVKFGFSLNPVSRRQGIGYPAVPGVRKDLSPSRTVVLAGMMPGKFVDEIRFHKTHKDEALSYCSEWYAGDSVAVQELLAWSFDFPEMFYTERPRGSEYNWLLREPGKTWQDQMRETMLRTRKKI